MQEGSLGYMLQGVSQQPERVQPDGHVKESINLYPDPNNGLVSRPGADFVARIEGNAKATRKRTVTVANQDFNILYKEGYLRLIRYDGTVYTLEDNDLLGYIGDDMTFFGSEGEIIALNRDKVVEVDDQADDSITDWAYAYALGGEFSRVYSMRLVWSNAVDITVSYTTPNGTSAGHAAQSSGSAIIQQLSTLMQAHMNFPASTTILRNEEVLYIFDTALGTPKITMIDGTENTILRGGNAVAKTIADVPRFARKGAVMRVRGQTATIDDDLWLRFFTDDDSIAVNDGFGQPGFWREWFDPSMALAFDRDTMPHIITIDNTLEEAELNRGAWLGREIGNEENNPTPSFVGRAIKDVGEMQSRLWFLSGGFFIASQTNRRNSFFRRTATTQLATDPIDIKSTKENEVELEYGVGYEQNLLIFGSTGQFVVDGTLALSAQSASLSPTTGFEASTKSRPVVAGQSILFPYTVQQYSGVNEIRPSEDISFLSVDSVTKNIKQYIMGEIRGMAAEGNAGIALVHTDAEGFDDTVWVYNWLWQGNQKQQLAWHKWKFPDTVEHVFSKNGVMYIWTEVENDEDADLILCELRPDRPEDLDLPYHAALDYKQRLTIVDNELVLDRDDYSFVAAAEGGGYEPGLVVTPLSVVDGVYVFSDEAPEQVYAGVIVETYLECNRPIVTDWRGNKKPSQTIVIGKYVVDYTESGPIEAYMINRYRGDQDNPEIVIDSETFPLDDSPEDAFGTSVRSGSFDVPWGDDNKISRLLLMSRTPLPVEYVEVRWYGQVYKGME